MTRFYDTANWKHIQKAQLAREPACQGCEQAPAMCVDHVKPITAGGAKRERSNLQSLCRACHDSKSGCDRDGRVWIPPKHRGCDEHGIPRDPHNAWNIQRR